MSWVTMVMAQEVRRVLKWVNNRMSARPEGIWDMFWDAPLISWLMSLLTSSMSLWQIPWCFKKSTILPVTEHNKPMSVTCELMKVFERPVKDFICPCILSSLDPLQNTNHPNKPATANTTHILHKHTSKIGVRITWDCLSEVYCFYVPKSQTLFASVILCI